MGMLAGIGSALATAGKTALKASETKVNRKLGTSFGKSSTGTSKPQPAATSMSQTAPVSTGMSARRQSARSGAESEYIGVDTSGM